MVVTENPQCAFCGSVIQTGEQTFRCPVCQTLYHVDCWQACNNKCATLGCPGACEPNFARKPDISHSPKPLDMHIEDIDDVIKLFSQPIEQFSSRISPAIWWEDPVLSIFVSGFLMFLMGGVYRYIGVFLQWGSGEYHISFSEKLYAIGQFNLVWWIFIGSVYGFFHYSFTSGRLKKPYRIIQMIIATPYLLSFAYQCGYAVFVFEYCKPEILWGLPDKITWLAPYLAWLFTIVAFFAVVGLCNTNSTIYFLTFCLFTCFLVVGFLATLSALLGGLTLGGIGWIGGSIIDFLWNRHDLTTKGFAFGLSAGGNLSFILGIIGGIKIIINSWRHSFVN